MHIVQYPPTKSFYRKKENKRSLKALLNRAHLGPLGAKLGVISLFTFLWLFVVLVRSDAPRNTVALEGSSLMGLATSLQQHAVSGRDFQSMFGPGTQFLAWFATSMTKTRSSVDAYAMIAFFFCMISAMLMAATLLVCNRVSWRESAIVYAFCFLLNLFFDVFDFRIALLLLSAAFAYRITAAEALNKQLIWATATGLLCFVSQLITFELGIYAVVAVVCALIAGGILTRNAWVLLGIEVIAATLAALNIGLVGLFKLTSANYEMLFDYQNYSLEILRGYHNTMGIMWQLPLKQTIVLVLAAGYIVGKCIMLARKAEPLDASLFASMGLAAVIWVRSAFVTSDTPHITAAFAPMIVVLALLSTREWALKQARWAWVFAVCAVLFAWPSFNFKAPMDMFQIVRGEVPVRKAIRNLYRSEQPVEASILPNLTAQDLAGRGDLPLLAFPYENHVVAGGRRPLFAPVLESYAASTDSLERYYIQAIDKQRRTGLDILYVANRGVVPQVDGVLAITRTPNVFEYLYKNFELVSDAENVDGPYELRQRRQAREVAIEQLPFSVPQQLTDSGIIRLSAPSTCGLVRMQMRISYTKTPLIFRPRGIEMTMSDGDNKVWRGSVRPLEPNNTFVTYISPLPQQTFHKVFGQDPVQGLKWDKIEYRNLPADLLGSRASRIRVDTIQCLDPEKFGEAAPTP